MALRSFDSQTRLGIPRPTKSERAAFSASHETSHEPRYQVEQYADEGTLILEPAPISVAPSSYATIPPPPPSSVRPPMPSWDDRSGWAPVGSANEVTASTRVPPKASTSASAMVLMATAAMLAALVSIGFMHKANRSSDAEIAAAAQQPAPQPTVTESNAAAVAPPPAAPIAPPVPAIDMDEEKPVAAVAPKPVVAAPVVNVAPPQTQNVQAPAKAAKEKAPAQAAQQKALEDLLEQLGEEQLKR